jgi:hypothetical protein
MPWRTSSAAARARHSAYVVRPLTGMSMGTLLTPAFDSERGLHRPGRGPRGGRHDQGIFKRHFWGELIQINAGSIMDLRARRPAVRRPRSAGSDLLLLPRSGRWASRTASCELRRVDAGGRLCRVQPVVRRLAREVRSSRPRAGRTHSASSLMTGSQKVRVRSRRRSHAVR